MMRNRAAFQPQSERPRPLSPDILDIARAIGRMMARDDYAREMRAKEAINENGDLRPVL